MTVFEELKKVSADIVCIQEPYVGGDILAHTAYKVEWRMIGEQKEEQVMIRIAVTTRYRVIVEARIDIINHPYIQELNVWKLEERPGRKRRRTRVVNMYDNHLRADQM